MKSKNHNIRFNTEKADECRAWELLHSQKVRQMFRSQNKFVIQAVNDYYDRCVAMRNDPYLETREKEDAFAERIVETVEKKVMSNLPALFGMYMAQMQVFPLSVPMGAYTATQGGMVCGQVFPNGAGNRDGVMNGADSSCVSDPADAAVQYEEAIAEQSTEPPDNELIDFDAF